MRLLISCMIVVVVLVVVAAALVVVVGEEETVVAGASARAGAVRRSRKEQQEEQWLQLRWDTLDAMTKKTKQRGLDHPTLIGTLRGVGEGGRGPKCP